MHFPIHSLSTMEDAPTTPGPEPPASAIQLPVLLNRKIKVGSLEDFLALACTGTPFIAKGHTQLPGTSVSATHKSLSSTSETVLSAQTPIRLRQASRAHLCCLICRMENLLAGSYSSIPV